MNPEFVRFVDIPDVSIRKQVFLDYFHRWESSLYQEADLGIIDIPEWVSLPKEEKVKELLKVIEKQFDSASGINPNSHWNLLGYDNSSRFAFGSIRSQLVNIENGNFIGDWYDLSGNGFGRKETDGNYLVGYAVQTTLDKARRIERGFTIFIENIRDYAIKQGLGFGTLSPFSGKRRHDEEIDSIGIKKYVEEFIKPQIAKLKLPFIDAVRMHINKGAKLLKNPETGEYLIWPDYKKHPPSQDNGGSTEYLPAPGSMY